MNPRLKQIIKNKLSKDLSSVSIIEYNGSIWFIDAKSKYWYLELYKKTKTLWWRLDFFEDFFLLFSMEQNEFVPIISEWVEEVLNGKIVSMPRCGAASKRRVEEVLNCEVVSTLHPSNLPGVQVEEVLNGKITSTKIGDYSTTFEMKEVLDGKILSTVGNLPPSQVMVEKVLKGEVVSTQGTPGSFRMEVEEVLAVSTHDSQLVDFILGEKVLKGEVVSTRRQKLRQETQVKEILNTVVVSDVNQMFIQQALCHNLMSKMIETTTHDPSDYFQVEDVLPHKEINNTT
jgi:hypothetical protein